MTNDLYYGFYRMQENNQKNDVKGTSRQKQNPVIVAITGLFWRRTTLRCRSLLRSLAYTRQVHYAVWFCTAAKATQNKHATSHPLVGSFNLRQKNKTCPKGMFLFFGGGHGTRTHGAVTPYLISNQAP